jgi:hypothetical protein
MAEKRLADDSFVSSECKRQQLYNYADVLYSILERLHQFTPNLIQFFWSFLFVNRTFHSIISKLPTKTPQQMRILHRILHQSRDITRREDLEILHQLNILPCDRLTTAAGTGKTRLMLEACATILHTQSLNSVIVCSESIIPMYMRILSGIDKANHWTEPTNIVWFDPTNLIRKSTKAIICLSTKNYSLTFATYFWKAGIRHIFTDDYTGAKYPRIVCSLGLFMRARNNRPISYLALTTNDTDPLDDFYHPSDPHLTPPPTTIDFNVVTRCSLCPLVCKNNQVAFPLLTSDTLPHPFDDLLNVICRDEPKVVLLMQFSRFTDQQKDCIQSIIEWGTKTGRTGRVIYARNSTLKRMGEQIAEFNSCKRALIVLDPHHNSACRGHSIYGSAIVFINTVSFHSRENCAREFDLYEQPPSPVCSSLLEMINRIRSPDTPFKKLKVSIYDAAVSLLIPLSLTATGKFTMIQMRAHQKTFACKNKVESYNYEINAHEVKKRICAELFLIQEKIDKYILEHRSTDKPYYMSDDPDVLIWSDRERRLNATKLFLERSGHPEHLCTVVREYLLSCLPAFDQRLFKQIDLTHFVIEFL